MKTVLIVDDDADDIKFLRTAIRYVDASIQCINASNGQGALDILANASFLQPDYIFLDLNMPRMDGRECLKRIKNIASLEDIPVIIYSTSKREVVELETVPKGAVYFLTKPTKLSVLKEQVSNIFDGKWELIRR